MVYISVNVWMDFKVIIVEMVSNNIYVNDKFKCVW